MSMFAYNACSIALGIGLIAAFASFLIFLVAALVGWKGPYRNRRLMRSLICLAACPLLIAIHQGILFYVFLPSLGREARRAAIERREASSLVRVGDAAPSFIVTTAGGETFSLDAHRGKIVLINFFATWCGPCLMELPHIEEIWNRHGDDERFALIVIGREEADAAVRSFREENHFTFPMAADPQRTIYAQYAEESIPRNYLIDAEGRICFASTGFEAEAFKELRREIERRLMGK